MSNWTTFIKDRQSQYLGELIEFLRIPSVSSLPDHKGDVQRAAKWVANRMESAGIEGVRILPTGGHPVVYGDFLHAPGKPTILIYGHFDTQPAEPLDNWDHPPFDPIVRDNCVFARGASDDKGNMFVPILAVEALLQCEGKLPVNVKFFFEGQEEIGSPQIPAFVEANKDLLSCNLVVSADGLQWTESQPALFLGFKGICALQIDVEGPRHDVHSGIYGGAIQNPLHALARIVDSMHSDEGQITVDGFYKDVWPLTQADRDQIDTVPYDESGYKSQLGVPEVFGESGYTTYERAWARPTLEVNGMWGGFQEEGIMAVIPNAAHAKITCRLVSDQKPDDILQLISDHVQRVAPTGVTVSTKQLSSYAYPYLMPMDHPGNHAAHAVLSSLYGKDPYYVRLGGTLPICALFLDVLEAYTVMFGFCLEDEGIHGPNEYFRLSSFERGQQAYGMLLEHLGQLVFD